jgi:hypothetical protein
LCNQPPGSFVLSVGERLFKERAMKWLRRIGWIIAAITMGAAVSGCANYRPSEPASKDPGKMFINSDLG